MFLKIYKNIYYKVFLKNIILQKRFSNFNYIYKELKLFAIKIFKK